MNKAPKIALGIFAAIGIIVTLKLITSTINVSGSNVCNQFLSNEYISPDGTRSITVEHRNCSQTGANSSVLLGSNDAPNKFEVLLSLNVKTYENDDLVFFPPPLAVQWYSGKEVHIVAPTEFIREKKNGSRGGIKVQYFNL